MAAESSSDVIRGTVVNVLGNRQSEEDNLAACSSALFVQGPYSYSVMQEICLKSLFNKRDFTSLNAASRAMRD